MFYRTSLFIFLVVIATSCSDSASQKSQPSNQDSTGAISDLNQQEELSTSFLDRENETSGIDYKKKFTNLPPVNEGIIEFGSYQMQKPSTWFWMPPTSTYVLSNYVLPGIQGEDSGLLSISEFQLGDGGDFETNILRWKTHFRTFGGAPIKPIIGNITIEGDSLQTVHIRGEYMGAGAAWHKPDHTLLVVLIESDTNRYFLKMLGASETISAHRDSLYDAIQSLEIVPES